MGKGGFVPVFFPKNPTILVGFCIAFPCRITDKKILIVGKSETSRNTG